MNHYYERLDENLTVRRAPYHDADGKITGKHILNLQAYFDENPAERISLGYIKHLTYTEKEVKEQFPYHPGSQALIRSVVQIDANTVQDTYTVYDKTEDMLYLEEQLRMLGLDNYSIIYDGFAWEG